MAATADLLIAAQGEAWDDALFLAQRYHTGVEIGDFGDPDLLEGDWPGRVEELRPLLAGIPGRRTLHGPRSELNPGLRDRGLVALAWERYLRAIEIAALLEVEAVVFHSGFNPLIRAPGFTRRWTRRSALFWQDLAREAAGRDLEILVENVWEPHPEGLRDLIEAIDRPNVRACFDVGHANVYSREPPQRWLAHLGDLVTCLHLHNNDGRMDTHQPLEEGTVEFARFLPLLALHPQPPRLVLEVSGGRRALEEGLLYIRRLLGREA